LSDRQAFHRKLFRVFDKPPGYLTGLEYAERMGCSLASIMAWAKKGRIPYKYMVSVKKRRQNKQYLAIDWNATIYDLIMDQRQAYRPKDFKENKERTYKPLDAPKWERPSKDIEALPDTPLYGKTGGKVGEILDLSDAKLRSEKLKIEKQEFELMHARNEVIEMSLVVQERAESAVAVRVAVQAAIQRLAPLLAAESDPREVKKILLDQLNGALKSLGVGSIEDVN